MAKCFLKLMWVHLVMDMRNELALCSFSCHMNSGFIHVKSFCSLSETCLAINCVHCGIGN